ncbi:MAG: hypothetical protein QN715_11510 [Nitrososphaeraceae archaeon]|nr:hypothetical protein [Nitrososphaeraceae archaeon]
MRWVLNITNKLFSVEQLNEEKVRSVRADFHLRESEDPEIQAEIRKGNTVNIYDSSK